MISNTSKVSEKSLELNVGAELLWLMRSTWGMPKVYLRGLTQAEEHAQGPDFFAELSPDAKLLAFQFKAPKGHFEASPYRFTLVREQHSLLHKLARDWPDSVYYVFPFFSTPAKLHQYVPSLLNDTWLLRVADMEPDVVFAGQRTKVIHCSPGLATINPQYRLENPSMIPLGRVSGVPARAFALWYQLEIGQPPSASRRNPWRVRGLRVAVIP